MKTLKILNVIKRVMQEVDKYDRRINMSDFYLYVSRIRDTTAIHNCNTPACILGYCGLDPEFCEITGCTNDPEFLNDSWQNLITQAHNEGFEFGKRLFDSLFEAFWDSRNACARILFSDPDIFQLKFLNTDYPQASDVIEYLDHLINYVEVNHAN